MNQTASTLITDDSGAALSPNPFIYLFFPLRSSTADNRSTKGRANKYFLCRDRWGLQSDIV